MQAPTSAICAIVRLINGVQHPAVRFQVTLRPDQVTGPYIRLGRTPEDEMQGWFKLEDLVIEHVLGKAQETDGKWTVQPLLEAAQ